ncbi:isocitrate lyase/PEP mutase family protein [Nonomuraea sp. NPDC002799]
MTTDSASVLRALHVSGTPLILANAWDAASARAVQEAGFPAVATGSAAVAHVLGYEDGENTPVGEMMAAVARIVRAVGLPVTADLERGYGLKPVELVERLAATGAVGCNLEDSYPDTGRLAEVGAQADFLAEVRAAAGAGLVINARIDAQINARIDAGNNAGIDAGVRGPGSREVVVERGRRYLEAGADCVYPIRVGDEEEIQALTAELGGPVNIYYRRGGPSLGRLAELGVARISFGSGLHHAAHVHAQGMFELISQGRAPY